MSTIRKVALLVGLGVLGTTAIATPMKTKDETPISTLVEPGRETESSCNTLPGKLLYKALENYSRVSKLSDQVEVHYLSQEVSTPVPFTQFVSRKNARTEEAKEVPHVILPSAILHSLTPEKETIEEINVRYFSNTFHKEMVKIIEIDYAALQRSNPEVLIEHIGDIYDAYFPQTNPESEREDFSTIFLGALKWAGVTAASSVIGNFSEVLITKGFEKLKKASSAERKPHCQATEGEFKKILELVKEARQQGRGIHIDEVVGRTGITDRERIRCWLKIFGGKRAYAGTSIGTYTFS